MPPQPLLDPGCTMENIHYNSITEPGYRFLITTALKKSGYAAASLQQLHHSHYNADPLYNCTTNTQQQHSFTTTTTSYLHYSNCTTAPTQEGSSVVLQFVYPGPLLWATVPIVSKLDRVGPVDNRPSTD